MWQVEETSGRQLSVFNWLLQLLLLLMVMMMMMVVAAVAMDDAESTHLRVLKTSLPRCQYLCENAIRVASLTAIFLNLILFFIGDFWFFVADYCRISLLCADMRHTVWTNDVTSCVNWWASPYFFLTRSDDIFQSSPSAKWRPF